MAQRPPRVAMVVLVDRRGWILLQERDEYAPVSANQWGFVGGHVEDGESFEAAIYRELEEETGIAWSSGLRMWREEQLTYAESVTPYISQLWVAATTLTDDDIVLGEGRQIVFVDPGRLSQLDLALTVTPVLRAFLVSRTYRALVAEAAAVDGFAP